MKNFVVLTEAIDCIERNLLEDVERKDIARHCHVSLSMLEKLFRYALHMSIKGYITKRRMTQAAKDIVKEEAGVTELAMKYRFNSAEVFTRAFKRVWNVTPSDFKDKWKFAGIFPKINYEYKEGEDLLMARKRVDISEAYEYLRDRKNSYVLCFDVQDLRGFNAVSQKCGDMAILEEAARIDEAAHEDMLLLRIGGDEFALITGLYDLNEATALMEKVLSKNGGSIVYEGRAFPLSLWCGVTKISEAHPLRYNELFTELHNAINESKKA